MQLVGNELEEAAMEARIYERTGIPPRALDEDAVRVVKRLRRKDHETYLVGGCVRDLLLGRVPKDFDIATSARPRQVKSLFRNCRIIGRRFKLAHLHFDRKILEVSTFRQRPQPSEEEEDGETQVLIRSDNAFGNAEEDAYRRDFTINALFYEPASDMVIDYVEGIPDLQNGLIRTIGDPLLRLKEDPIRILRAIKFSSRMAFQIEPSTWDAMREAAPDLKLGAPPRIYEELLRFLKSGFALRAFQLLRDSGSLQVLLPDLHQSLEAATPERRMRFWRMLEGLDSVNREKLTAEGTPLPTSVCLAALVFFYVEERALEEAVPERLVEYGRWIQDHLGDLFRDINTPKIEVALIKKIIPLQGRFEGNGAPEKAGEALQKADRTKGRRSGKAKKGRRRRSPKTSDAFQPALELLHVRAMAGLIDWELWETWRPETKPRKETGRALSTEPSHADRSHPHSHSPAERDQREEPGKGSAENQNQKAPKLKAGNRREEKARRGGGRENKGGSRPASREKTSRGSRRKAGNSKGRDSKKRGEEQRDSRRESKRDSKRKDRRRATREKRNDFPPLPEIDLDPNQIPTYGSIVGDTASIDKAPSPGDRSQKKKKKPKIGEGDAHDETHFVPPPPPDVDPAPRTPSNEPDVFGDW